MKNNSFEDNSLVTSALMRQVVKRIVPWGTALVMLALNVLVAWVLIPPELTSYSRFIFAAGLILGAPFACLFSAGLFRPIINRFKTAESDTPFPPLSTFFVPTAGLFPNP